MYVDLALLAGVAVALLLSPREAHAYIDPGVGSFMLQALIAAVAGGLLATRRRWRQLKGLFRRRAAPDATRDDARRGEAD